MYYTVLEITQFKQNPNAVMVASDVAARGLDIPLIENMIHYQLPHSGDIYIHRSGRTARARNEGISLMLCSPEESSFYRKICQDLKKGVFPKSGLKYTRAPKNYAIPDNFSIITTWGKSPNLNTIKGHIKYIDNRPVYYVNYGPNFELEIISNHSSSDAATKTQRAINESKEKSENNRMSGPLLFGLHLKQIQKNRPQSNYIRPLKQFNELSISTKKARARTVAKKIKKDFNQIAKENYHPNDQVTLKELSYTVANTPFHVEFGSQNIIKKNKYESAIVQIIDKHQISRDGFRALSAIQPNLPRDYAVSDQHTILTSKMANYIPIETFNLYNQDNLLLNEEFQLVKKVARR
ncbi:hypothetical protein C2G38_2051098, partial [Gigaspora rosea]